MVGSKLAHSEPCHGPDGTRLRPGVLASTFGSVPVSVCFQVACEHISYPQAVYPIVSIPSKMSMKAVGLSIISLSHRILTTSSSVIDRKKSVGVNGTSPRAYLKTLFTRRHLRGLPCSPWSPWPSGTTTQRKVSPSHSVGVRHVDRSPKDPSSRGCLVTKARKCI